MEGSWGPQGFVSEHRGLTRGRWDSMAACGPVSPSDPSPGFQKHQQMVNVGVGAAGPQDSRAGPLEKLPWGLVPCGPRGRRPHALHGLEVTERELSVEEGPPAADGLGCLSNWEQTGRQGRAHPANNAEAACARCRRVSPQVPMTSCRAPGLGRRARRPPTPQHVEGERNRGAPNAHEPRHRRLRRACPTPPPRTPRGGYSTRQGLRSLGTRPQQFSPTHTGDPTPPPHRPST